MKSCQLNRNIIHHQLSWDLKLQQLPDVEVPSLNEHQLNDVLNYWMI